MKETTQTSVLGTDLKNLLNTPKEIHSKRDLTEKAGISLEMRFSIYKYIINLESS